MTRQSVSEQELSLLTRQIRKLTPQQIDHLLETVGFRVFKDANAAESGEPPFRVVTKAFVENVHRDFKSAKSIVRSLVFECDLEQLRTNLRQLLPRRKRSA